MPLRINIPCQYLHPSLTVKTSKLVLSDRTSGIQGTCYFIGDSFISLIGYKLYLNCRF